MAKKTEHNADLATRLVDRHFGSSDGQLMVGQCPIGDIVAQHGTPLYVYDKQVLSKKLEALQAALSPRFDIFYSMKANPNQEILRFFIDRQCGIEIASTGELHQALHAGCSPKSILFAGPGKRDEELAFALQEAIGEIHVESLAEARRLSELAGQLQRRAQVSLRINPSEDAQGGAMRMGGKAAPFGIDEERLDEVVDAVAADPNLDLVGIHLFTGTQILDYQILGVQYRHAVSIARRVADRLGRPLKTIDFGGGLGIPYFAHEEPLDLEAFSREVAELITEVDADPRLAGARLIVEPGRFLVGEAGLYVSRIVEIKESRGKKFLIVDGGMHHHLAASGNLGQTIKRNYPVAIVNKLAAADVESSNAEAPIEKVDVVGPLCTPLDVLARGVELPLAEVGDLVAVFQSGAYGRTASPLGFLSHDGPAEVLVDGDAQYEIRRRGTVADLLADQPVIQTEGATL